MAPRRSTGSRSSQRGAALLVLLLIILLATAYTVVNTLSTSGLTAERQARSSTALAQAKDALIGFAVTYRDSHANQVFGFLPCPDADNNGQTDLSCGVGDVSTLGRIPWQTLGLPVIRDGDNECLWYAVSGSAKDTPKTAAFNWDTPGQLIVQDAPGTTTLAGVSAHERPLALILAPRGILGSQTRPPAGTTECGGSLASTDYLEGATISSLASATSTVKLSTTDSVASGTNKDQGLWITSKEVFDRIKKRSDFKIDIDALVNDLANCLNNVPPGSLPVASAGNKGIDNVISLCPATGAQKINVQNNWRDNLLYAGGPAGNFTINGSPTTCRALLFFGGERTTRTVAPLTAQTRSTVAEKGDVSTFGDPAMYLEGANATQFPGNGAYSGATQFSATSASTDFVRCINGLPAGAASFASPSDFASFTPTGVAVTTDTATTPSAPTVSISDASGTGGGCFWFANQIPLAGKTMRIFYDAQFFYADTFALTGSGNDRGNGFTFQMVRSDVGAPNTCGTETNMGALGTADIWGSFSFIVETDVYKDTASATSTTSRGDPTENHTAIMTNGNLNHGLSGTMSAACNGTASGCQHSPANKFEQAPTPPAARNQRIEIHTGCNVGCGTCTPASHAAPNTYARISAWVDCTDCSDVVADLNRTTKPPTIQRCAIVNTEMNSIYFGFTGGFRSGATAGEAPAQGVTIKNFSLRSD